MARQIDSVKHKDRRTNIPTNELRGFLEEEERAPKQIRYPRDTSKDPQLVWKGKDEQDDTDLLVDVPPIYIQEKIHPQAIIENLRAETKKGSEQQLDLFGDFNGIKFEDLVDFYHHDQHWSNRMILGDSLQVMASLAEKEGLKGQVQVIYIDPPYGIKFGSNWQVSTRKRQVQDGRADEVTRQPEQIRAFRDTWSLGIHSYLTYLRDRLVISRALLSESGSVFVQIGDENLHLVRCVLDEVFGSGNFCGQIAFSKTSGLGSKLLAQRFDFLLWYAKDISRVKYRQLYLEKSIEDGTASTYGWVDLPDGTRRGMTRDEKADPSLIPTGAKIYKPDNITSQGNPNPPFGYQGRTYQQGWKTSVLGLERLGRASRLHVAANSLQYVRYLDDFRGVPLTNLWDDTATGNFTDEKIYVVQTGTKTIERCLLMATDPGDLVLDPTCGSGTTAYLAEQWGRRWITIDTSRVALALARTRLMTAKYPYYLLGDSLDGINKEAETTGKAQPSALSALSSDIRKGFVCRRVPHIKLKDIANNAEIDVIWARWREQLGPVRAKLNKILEHAWEEWEVPREVDDKWPQEARELLTKWWGMKRSCQEEIDASIARDAETELLYDQPYEDKGRIRVAGPFTVESLSPHRVLAADVERTDSEVAASLEEDSSRFVSLILSHLKTAGVQNTTKGERLQFERLEPCAGTSIHATGEYREGDKLKRVAVCIGPEHGTVGPDLVRDAAMEATQGPGHDLLLVCGLAFDPHVSGEAKDWMKLGRLLVLLTRINPDLTMGDELLKKTSAANLFMVFGEPDVKTDTLPDGKMQASIRGVDIYDPTTGVIRSASTEEIACWFVDTNYNGQSFFVRHAYFTGANEPYDKLRRSLRAEIDEAAWASLYSTVSRPFNPPETGKIAIKVINHYGDEVLKVYDITATKSGVR